MPAIGGSLITVLQYNNNNKIITRRNAFEPVFSSAYIVCETENESYTMLCGKILMIGGAYVARNGQDFNCLSTFDGQVQ